MKDVFNNIVDTIYIHTNVKLEKIIGSKNRDHTKLKKVIIYISKNNDVSFNSLSKKLKVSRQYCTQAYEEIDHQKHTYDDIKKLIELPEFTCMQVKIA